MENLNWSQGLNRIREQIETHRGMWPTVAFRLLATSRPDSKDNWLEVVVAHFQTTAVEQAGALDLVVDTPIVFEGVITDFQFASLLDSWAREEPFAFGKWVFFRPAQVASLSWSEDLTEDMLWGVPLLAAFPEHQSRYLVHRLEGSGVTNLPETLKSQVRAAATALERTPEQWSQDYLGLGWSVQMSYVVVHMPVPVAVDAFYETAEAELTVHVYYRTPYQARDFWLRVGQRWNVGVPTEPFAEDAYNESGWLRASWVQKIAAPEPKLRIWVGTYQTPNQFKWQVSVSTLSELPSSLQQRRETFLQKWYGLAHQTFAGQLEQVASPASPQKKGQLVAPAFEFMLANACSALGYAVFVGSSPISTPGVDLIAFDEKTFSV